VNKRSARANYYAQETNAAALMDRTMRSRRPIHRGWLTIKINLLFPLMQGTNCIGLLIERSQRLVLGKAIAQIADPHENPHAGECHCSARKRALSRDQRISNSKIVWSWKTSPLIRSTLSGTQPGISKSCDTTLEPGLSCFSRIGRSFALNSGSM
jgi:hypothetical protein